MSDLVQWLPSGHAVARFLRPRAALSLGPRPRPAKAGLDQASGLANASGSILTDRTRALAKPRAKVIE